MLNGTMNINKHQLQIGGINVDKLKEEHGTPLIVYDLHHIEENISNFKLNFASSRFKATTVYASKAFLTKAMAKLIEKEQLHIDAVSAGELFTIKEAGFSMQRVVFHGNNKSIEELKLALNYNIGYIVVDHEVELKRIIELATEKKVKTLLRVNPGVKANTHEYIQTSLLDSKFGISVFDDEKIKEIIELYQQSEIVELCGFHCHIGSQVFEMKAFHVAADEMIKFSKKHIPNEVPIINLGGGFGITYTKDQLPPPLSDRLKQYIKAIEESLIRHDYRVKEVMIEPGRSIVGNAGTTLYSVGSTKETYGGKKYIFTDGGMTDNIRPALYKAKYHAIVANKANLNSEVTYSIVGKCCESGDIVVNDIKLPIVEENDIIAIFSTGAYGYSMASNYNRLQRPEVIFVKDGQSEVIVSRETLKDLIRNDV